MAQAKLLREILCDFLVNRARLSHTGSAKLRKISYDDSYLSYQSAYQQNTLSCHNELK